MPHATGQAGSDLPNLNLNLKLPVPVSPSPIVPDSGRREPNRREPNPASPDAAARPGATGTVLCLQGPLADSESDSESEPLLGSGEDSRPTEEPPPMARSNVTLAACKMPMDAP